MQTDKLNLSYDNDENKEFITSLGKEFFSIESGETHSNWDKVESFNSNNSPFMLLGLTQTGKSTLINYLLGEKFEFVEVEGNACMALTIKKDDPNSNNDNKKLPIIGNGFRSCTYIPEMFSIPEEISTKRHALVDTAGFQDTSYNKAKVAAVEIFREEGIKRIKSIRNVIVLVTANQLMGTGGELLALSKLLGETFKKGEYRPFHFTFIVNRVDAFDVDYKNHFNRFIKNKISYEEFIGKLKKIVIEKLESLYHSRFSSIAEGNLSAEQKDGYQKELEFISFMLLSQDNILIFDDIEERNFEKRIIAHLDKISAKQDFIENNPRSEEEIQSITSKIEKLTNKVVQYKLKLCLENMQVSETASSNTLNKDILNINQEIEASLKEINSLSLELNPFLSIDSINFTNEKEETSKFREAAGYISQKFQNAVKDINKNIDDINNFKKLIKDNENKCIQKTEEIKTIKNTIKNNHQINVAELLKMLEASQLNAENNIKNYQEDLEKIKQELHELQEELKELNTEEPIINEPVSEQNIIVKEAAGSYALDDKYTIEFKGDFDKVVTEFSDNVLITFDDNKDINNLEIFKYKVIKDKINSNSIKEYYAELIPGYIPKAISRLGAAPGWIVGGNLVGVGLVEGAALAAPALLAGPAGLAVAAGAQLFSWYAGYKIAKKTMQSAATLDTFRMSENYYNFKVNVKFCKIKKNFYVERINILRQEIEKLEKDKKNIEECIRNEMEIYNKSQQTRSPENIKTIEKDLQKELIKAHEGIIVEILQGIKEICLNNEKLINDISRFEKELENNCKQLAEYKDSGEYLYKIIQCLGIGSKLIHKEGSLVKFVECYEKEYHHKAENYLKEDYLNNSFNSIKFKFLQYKDELMKSSSFKMLLSQMNYNDQQQENQLEVNKSFSNKLNVM